MAAEQMDIQGEQGARMISAGFGQEGMKGGQRQNPVHKSRFWKALGHGIVVCWRTFVNLCLWWLRLFWNLAWLLFSAFCGILAAFMLAGAGGTAVLLFQGYPFVGILLLSLGGLLCFGALSWGAFSLMIPREKKTAADVTETRLAEDEKSRTETQTGKKKLQGTDSEIQDMDLEKIGDMEKESQEEVRHE